MAEVPLPQRERRRRKRPPQGLAPNEEGGDVLPAKRVDGGGTNGVGEASAKAKIFEVEEGWLRPEYRFEYLDHTADIQVHGWGKTYSEAFEQVAYGMYNYMTPLEGIRVPRGSPTVTVEASGHDLESLLYNFLHELLFHFHTELRALCDIRVTRLDCENWTVCAVGRGEIFDRSVHECGTEIKAITYSAMTMKEVEDRVDLYVIVDI